MVLKEEPAIELIGQAPDGAEAVQMAGEALPDVVLMDIRMPKITGIEAARQTREASPSASIVMLAISDGGYESAVLSVPGPTVLAPFPELAVRGN